jgi:hypothetical protein
MKKLGSLRIANIPVLSSSGAYRQAERTSAAIPTAPTAR